MGFGTHKLETAINRFYESMIKWLINQMNFLYIPMSMLTTQVPTLAVLVASLLLSSCSTLSGRDAANRAATNPPAVLSETKAYLIKAEEYAAQSDVALDSAQGAQVGQEEEKPELTDELYPGTGKFVNKIKRKTSKPVEGDITLNFENTDIREVVKVILGDILNVNYLLDPGVRGGVTMQTGSPMPKSALLSTLETLLRMNGAALVKADNVYRVIPAGKAIQGLLVPQLADSATPLPAGYNVQIVPLKYIAVSEMEQILKPFTTEGSVIRADGKRNLLILAGTAKELINMRDTIHTFDVDWMEGLSVGFFALKYSEVADVVADLNAITGAAEEGMGGLVKILPVESANGMLVVSPRAEYLSRIAEWITRLDNLGSTEGGTEEQLFVYRVKNGEAEKLSELLNKLFDKKSVKKTKKASLAPGLKPTSVKTKGKSAKTSVASSKSKSSSSASLQSELRIVADTENNALLIMATAKDYERILNVLTQLDVVPLQVHIEATIVEVLLTDDLKYGIQWAFSGGVDSDKTFSGSLDGTIDGGTSSGFANIFPGFNWSLIDSSSQIRAILSAFAGDALVNVLSAPSVMVLDNQTAKIQVGDQVPIATQQQQSTDANSTVINSIQYRDTGVTLNVTPRINPGGLVTMEVEQEVSSVSETSSSSLDSPTIQTRNIASTVAVQSGQSVILGGLIRDETSEVEGGVPFLYNMPVVGALFGETSKKLKRTELVVILTPRVIGSSRDARQITEDFRDRMKGLKGVF